MSTRILIDPGHGGTKNRYSFGCKIKSMHEKEYTLNFSLALMRELSQRGITCRATREVDIDMAHHQRAQIAELWAATHVVSVHVNAMQDASTRGLQLYTKREHNWMSYHFKEQLPQEERLQGIYCIEDISWNGPKTVLRQHKIPALLLELGFSTNRVDLKRLVCPKWQEKMMQWVADSVELLSVEEKHNG